MVCAVGVGCWRRTLCRMAWMALGKEGIAPVITDGDGQGRVAAGETRARAVRSFRNKRAAALVFVTTNHLRAYGYQN